MNLMHQWYMAPDEPAGGGGTEETAAADAAAAAAAASQEPSTPWNESLARAFPDEAVRGQVDQYLRSEIQPYVTRKEQELGEVATVWGQLWDENQSFPTYLELANTLYGEDVALELAQTLAKHYEQQGLEPEVAAEAAVQEVGAQAQQQAAQQTQPQGPPDLETWLKTVPPEFQEYVTQQFESREDKTYNDQLDAITVTEPTLAAKNDTFNARELFSRYVGSMEGDLPSALATWQREMAPMIKANPEQFGFTDPAKAAEAATEAARKQVPTVLGGSATAGGTTPPMIKAHQTMDEALHDFWVDQGHAK